MSSSSESAPASKRQRRDDTASFEGCRCKDPQAQEAFGASLYPLSPHDQGDCGSTDLHVACSSFYSSISADAIIKLVRQGSDPAARTCDGSTPLHKAVAISNREAVKALITASTGIQVNLLVQQNNAGQNALHLAISYDEYYERNLNLELIEVLLTVPVERRGHLAEALAAPDTAGRTVLQLAVELRYVAAAKRLIEVCDELGILHAVLRQQDKTGTDVVMLVRRMEGDDLWQLFRSHCAQVCTLQDTLCGILTCSMPFESVRLCFSHAYLDASS
jgi:ankyrin repeat protein